MGADVSAASGDVAAVDEFAAVIAGVELFVNEFVMTGVPTIAPVADPKVASAGGSSIVVAGGIGVSGARTSSSILTSDIKSAIGEN